MKSGVCPKCRSQEILVFETSSEAKEKDKHADMEKLGLLDKAYTTRYVCCSCGYTERYFDGKDLEKLKKKFKKVRG